MTTVAFDGKTIAYDSRSIADGMISSDSENKRHREKGVNYFLAGMSCDLPLVVAWHQGERPKATHKANSDCLIVKDGKVYNAGIGTDGYFFEVHPITEPYAIGSGAAHAMTAMDMGADAVTAVKMAKKRDPNTGGKIRTFKVTT